MSTNYIPHPTAAPVTLSQLQGAFPNARVDGEGDLCVTYNSDCAFVSFTNGVMSSAAVYGGSRGGAIAAIERQFTMRMISEHDDDFEEHLPG